MLRADDAAAMEHFLALPDALVQEAGSVGVLGRSYPSGTLAAAPNRHLFHICHGRDSCLCLPNMPNGIRRTYLLSPRPSGSALT